MGTGLESDPLFTSTVCSISDSVSWEAPLREVVQIDSESVVIPEQGPKPYDDGTPGNSTVGDLELLGQRK